MSNLGLYIQHRKPPNFWKLMLARIALLIVFIGSLWLIWWSVGRLTETNQEMDVLNQQFTQLTDQVEKLELNWNEEENQRIEQQFVAAHSKLFASEGAVNEWQQSVQELGTSLALHVNAELGAPQPEGLKVKHIAVVPATLEIQPIDDSPGNTFQRLLTFNKHLTGQTQRVDLIELKVSGNTNSVGRAQAKLWLWQAQDPAP